MGSCLQEKSNNTRLKNIRYFSFIEVQFEGKKIEIYFPQEIKSVFLPDSFF